MRGNDAAGGADAVAGMVRRVGDDPY